MSDTIRSIGSQMATMMYNLSRGANLPAETRDLMRDMHQRWDAAVSADKAPPPQTQMVGIVPPHCSGYSFGFEPGVLHVKKDGSGHIVVNEQDFILEDDRCEGPDGPEGSVHWIVRLDASEIVALRDFLNGAPTPPPQKVAVKPLEWNPYRAETPFGWYDINDQSDVPESELKGRPPFLLCGSRMDYSRHRTLDAARSAAQADYEARIRAALSAEVEG